MTDGRLDGKTALISGGAGGMGRAMAMLFAREGARIAIADVQAEAGRGVVAAIERDGGTARFVEADVADSAAVDRAVGATLDAYGRIDILCNHAGSIIVKPFLETTEGDWDRLMAINVKSMFLMSRAVLPGMLAAGGGVIVNTSSISGLTAAPMESAYCTTKGAILQLTRAIAVEFRDRGIRCNAICPAFVRTDHGMREIDALNALGWDASEQGIASLQGRICEPEEVARAALFLASDDSRFVNGASLVVDNTWTAAS
jgi:NAD(P)-dependent dehydrogenase (short-subunit alcohol dehydrogenase family)